MNLQDYQETDFSGLFGGQQDVNELLKAMQAGNITGRDTTDQLLTQEPLKVESLEKTLRLLEFRMKDIKLWNSIPKLTAYNTVEEFIQLESYGTDRGGFYGEGELSDVEDSKYRRRAELVKYIQVTGEVTLQAQMVRSFVDAMSKEVDNKTMWVIRKVDTALTKADSTMIDKEFNGIYAQHANIGVSNGDLYPTLDAYQDSRDVIDMRGRSIKQQDLETASVSVDDAFGTPDTFFAPPTVLSGIYEDFYARQRFVMQGGYQQQIGMVPSSILTQFGPLGLNQDKFMKKPAPRRLSDLATSSKSPSAPSVSNQVLALDSTSRFQAGEAHTGALGTVFYAVSSINQYGESALTVFNNTGKVTLTAGNSVDLSFSPGGAGAYPATAFQIYRSKVTTAANATTGNVLFYPVFKVSAAQRTAGYDGALAGVVRDKNRFLPDTEEGFVSAMDEEVMYFKQLAPISKLDLAVLAPSNRFITFLWGTPVLVSQNSSTGRQKMVRFINVGPYVFS